MPLDITSIHYYNNIHYLNYIEYIHYLGSIEGRYTHNSLCYEYECSLSLTIGESGEARSSQSESTLTYS